MDVNKLKTLGMMTANYLGGTLISGLAYIGDKLGLFKAMAGAGPLTSDALAAKTGCNERYVREWLKTMAAAEFIDFDAETEKYNMSEEAAALLANEDSPVFLAAGFQFAVPHFGLLPKVIDAFQNGGGIRYSELGDEIIEAIDRFHKPMFNNKLAQEYLPQVPGLKERLDAGIRVLDVGCGLGRSTLALASHFPNSQVFGLEPDATSYNGAIRMMGEMGVKNANFIQAPIQDLTQHEKFDLVLALDCIHDMVDPIGGLNTIRELLGEDGMFFWMEPIGSDNPMENRDPTRRFRQAISIYHCMSVSLAHGGMGLGTLIGEKGARELAGQAGFSHFERLAIEDPGQQFFRLHR